VDDCFLTQPNHVVIAEGNRAAARAYRVGDRAGVHGAERSCCSDSGTPTEERALRTLDAVA
jgi:hypothetical protein